jgi:DedD protein
MKTHSFEFTGKGLVGLTAALIASATLMVALGLIVGMAIQGSPVRIPGAETTASSTVASRGPVPPAVEDPAGWPFTGVPAAPAIDTTGADIPAVDVDEVPDKDTTAASAGSAGTPAPRPRAGVRAGFSTVAYTAAPADEDTDPVVDDTEPYVVQVGSFRNERNAKSLVARLTANGYRPTVVKREDNGRMLHVVRLGRVIGRERAERLAERIGDAERVIVAVVAERRSN